jgi:hypothetical protein
MVSEINLNLDGRLVRAAAGRLAAAADLFAGTFARLEDGIFTRL